MLYYGMLSAAVVMFGVQFFFNQIFEKESDSSSASAFVFTLGSSLAGIPVLLIINGLKLELTLFSVLMAVVSGLDSMLFMVCSIKALGKVNLSRYSVFSMLGGMILPFVAGIAFFHEKAGIGKLLCFAVIFAAVIVTVRDRKNRAGMKYCWGVFLANGLSGVISTVFQNAQYSKCNEAQFSVLCAAVTAVFAFTAVLILKKPQKKLTAKAYISMGAYGILNRLGNYLLLLALANLSASVQYPFVTGGVIIVSTLIGLLAGQKPSKEEIASVLLAFAGVVMLMFV
ncbi:MAG: EamA family transporter [Clostridia bacterium]|nr:EamA family transporter [Clostridia bacterium]